VGELMTVVLGVAAPEGVGTCVVIDIEMVPVIVDRHSLACKSQECPSSQHPSEHGVVPSPQSSEQ